jgi:hypothetical protein
MQEPLHANQQVWPGLVAPLLLVLQQGDEVDLHAQLGSARMLSIITNEQHPSEMPQAVLQQLLQHLPGLLAAACCSRRMPLPVNLARLAAAATAYGAEQGTLQPEQLQPVLQSLVQSVDARTALKTGAVIAQLTNNEHVRVQLYEQAATQLPALLQTLEKPWHYPGPPALRITAAAYRSASLRQALRENAGQVLAALRQLLDSIVKKPEIYLTACGPAVRDIMHTLQWMLWEPVDGQAPAAAAAAAGPGIEVGEMGAVPQLLWPPHNVQLLGQPELLDCMIVLAGHMDSAAFAMRFVSRIVAASEEAAVLLAPRRMQLVAAAVGMLAAGLEQLRQQQAPGDEGSGPHGRAYRSLVQLLQCMAPLSARREGLLVLAPHVQALRHAAAALQHGVSEHALQQMRLTQQQVIACRQWAEQTPAAAAAALQETTAQHAAAIFRQESILIENVAPAYGEPRAFAVALNGFVRAAARVEHLQQLLLLAGVEAGG